MTTQLNILFMAVSSRTNTNGEVPVYCRLTYKQKQKRFMIGCTVPLKIWDRTKQQSKGRSPKADPVNQQINLLVQKTCRAEAELLKLAEPFEIDDIISKIQGTNKAACRTLMQVCQHRLKAMRKLEGIDYKACTIIKFLRMEQAIKNFLQHEYHTEDIALSKLNIIFLQNLEAYLKTEKGMKLITVNKVIQNLKSVTNTAIDKGWLNSNPFPGHKFRHDRLNIIYLTIAELSRGVSTLYK
jgi:hypothetical protein